MLSGNKPLLNPQCHIISLGHNELKQKLYCYIHSFTRSSSLSHPEPSSHLTQAAINLVFCNSHVEHCLNSNALNCFSKTELSSNSNGYRKHRNISKQLYNYSLGLLYCGDFFSKMFTTRTARTPAFWGYPPPPHDYPYHWVILDPKSKEDKVKVTNSTNSPKFQIF